jgi:hypothetical protein
LFGRGRGCEAFGFTAMNQLKELLEAVLKRVILRFEFVVISLGNYCFH